LCLGYGLGQRLGRIGRGDWIRAAATTAFGGVWGKGLGVHKA